MLTSTPSWFDDKTGYKPYDCIFQLNIELLSHRIFRSLTVYIPHIVHSICTFRCKRTHSMLTSSVLTYRSRMLQVVRHTIWLLVSKQPSTTLNQFHFRSWKTPIPINQTQNSWYTSRRMGNIGFSVSKLWLFFFSCVCVLFVVVLAYPLNIAQVCFHSRSGQQKQFTTTTTTPNTPHFDVTVQLLSTVVPIHTHHLYRKRRGKINKLNLSVGRKQQRIQKKNSTSEFKRKQLLLLMLLCPAVLLCATRQIKEEKTETFASSL